MAFIQLAGLVSATLSSADYDSQAEDMDARDKPDRRTGRCDDSALWVRRSLGSNVSIISG